MFILVTGGSGSGKSMYAEQRVLECSRDRRIYLATMRCFDQESVKRIERHRRLRADKGFTTVERYTNLSGLTVPAGSTVLLECMSNLVANELYEPEGAKENTADAVIAGIRRLLDMTEQLVVVTNEIFSDGVIYDPETRRYQHILGEINCRMAELADEVVEVVYGCPVVFKAPAGLRRKEEAE